MKTLIVSLVLLLSTSPAGAAELYSFTWGAWGLPASTGLQIVTLPHSSTGFPGYIPGQIGAGAMPPTSFTIVGVEVCQLDTNGWLQGPTDPSAFVMIGQTPPNGDAITPYHMGPGCERMMYPAGMGFTFVPWRDELHMHTGSAYPHSVRATIWYTTP